MMNGMLASVTERTREIGIQLAIRAQTGNILSQLLIEAILPSGSSDMLGVLLGLGTSVVLNKLADWSRRVVPGSLVGSFGSAALVRVASGNYPARRVSQINPILAPRAIRDRTLGPIPFVKRG